MILISIIIPTYKPQEYIWECLESIRLQTFPKCNFEVIIVLNGCGEPYKTQIEQYINNCLYELNIVFIHIDEGGVSNARNVALGKARGEYIAFIDDDDLISPKYLELLYDKASEDTISLCYPYAFQDGGNRCQLNYRITNTYNKLHLENKQPFYKARKYFSGPWMKLISRQIIQNRLFDKRFVNGEDSIFNFLISDRIRYVDFTSDEAVYYRRYRQNSAITTKRSLLAKLKNNCKMIWVYTTILLDSPTKYNYWFYITRILGAIRSII